MGLRKNGVRKGDSRFSITRASSFLRPNTFKRLARWLCSVRSIRQRRCCRQGSTAMYSIVLRQFSTDNIKCTKSFDKNFCKIKRF